MKIVIQKFGGTSVATEEKRKCIIKKIKGAINNGYKPVVVVSAMGRKGDCYSTDNLKNLISKDFARDNSMQFDLIVSCGEIISSVIMCNDLYNEGFNAIPLTGGQAGIITNDNYTNASLIEFDNKRIKKILSEDKIPVICGFQGVTKDGFITTLGRGGSDTTAAILGAKLEASKIEIYTDVDGIMTADPRIVQDASLIRVLNYDEVFQLADQGAKVIHPEAVSYAKEKNIPIIIKNTFSDCEGTIINSIGDKKSGRVITSITSTGNRCQIKIKLKENCNCEFYEDILEYIAKENISLDLINIFPYEQIFTISSCDKRKITNIFNKYKIKAHIIENCSKISLVGTGMKGIPGVMAKIYKALNDENINMLQTADSHMTIWCLVKDQELNKAINILHKAFKL